MADNVNHPAHYQTYIDGARCGADGRRKITDMQRGGLISLI